MTATNEVEKDRDRAEDQARLQLESIQAMVERLEHSTECSDPDPELCDLTDRQIYNGLNLYYEEGKTATEEEREEYHGSLANLTNGASQSRHGYSIKTGLRLGNSTG